MFSLGVLPRAF